jgi:hypothetical protein
MTEKVVCFLRSLHISKQRRGLMKKATCGLIAMALVMPLIVGAVTWTADSNQFHWIQTSTINRNLFTASQLDFHYRADMANGNVTILYNLPSRANGAKINVYNISGVLLKSFNIQRGSKAVQWNIAKDNVATGIYVAALQCGDVEKKIQLAIVK